MLAGFLSALGSRREKVALTCCVPYDLSPLSRRFPEIDWRPYDARTRRASIEACDAWLGLGGSPFQNAVSPWFAEHLASESALCAASEKPMYFLCVGGQDESAYADPWLRSAAAQAEAIWTRDPATKRALEHITRPGRVKTAADLAHVFFEASPPPPADSGRLTAVLNFDFGGWPGEASALTALSDLPIRERVWLAQEARELPGGERDSYAHLPKGERDRWRLQLADTPGEPLPHVSARWPSGGWLLTSRFHATLSGAWAGSRAVVIATNNKLREVASECGYPTIPANADNETVAQAFKVSVPPRKKALQARATAARQACAEFFATVGI